MRQDSAKKPASHLHATDTGWSFDCMSAAEFDAMEFQREWLVKDIFVCDQPGVIGGPKKILKTSLEIDMAISLASGLPFLGKFAVPKRRRVAVFCGENAGATLQETALRICAAKRVSLDACDVHWCLDLLRLDEEDHRAKLGTFLRDEGIEVVFIDPLYLCLLTGRDPVSTNNLFQIGSILNNATRVCLDAGATPIFVHHSPKSSDSSGTRPLSLNDLMFSGVGEFVRQWILLSRCEPYSPGSGRHELLLNVGGCAGHSGRWVVAVDEGKHTAYLSGRKWDVTVREPSDARSRRHKSRSDDWKE